MLEVGRVLIFFHTHKSRDGRCSIVVEKSILHFPLFRSFYLTFSPRQQKGVNVVWGRGEACTWYWWGNLRERDH